MLKSMVNTWTTKRFGFSLRVSQREDNSFNVTAKSSTIDIKYKNVDKRIIEDIIWNGAPKNIRENLLNIFYIKFFEK